MMNARKEKALAAMLTSNSIEDAAKKAGVTPKTLYNYLHKDTEFKQSYEEGKASLVQQATEQLRRSFNPAIATLWEIFQNQDENSRTRIQAARSLLEFGIKISDSTHSAEYDRRHLELEALRIEASHGAGPGASIPDDGFLAALNGDAATTWDSGALDDSREDWIAQEDIQHELAD